MSVRKRDEWSVGKVFHANAGELHDGIRLMAKDGKPYKRGVGVVIIQARYFGQIVRAWNSRAGGKPGKGKKGGGK